MNKNSFEYLKIIGRGGFGKVWLVLSKKYKKEYAMKEMSKKKIIDKKSVHSILSERNLLAQMNHPFIVNMHFAFQDKENLYLGLDILKGGDLRYHICFKPKFQEEEIKFFLANIILALEYIHKNDIIHRDLKPENIVIGSNGYLRLTDFGIAHKVRPDNKSETSGTPGYMAPEVLYATNHTVVADYFALGVMGYELMIGHRPYIGKNRKEIREKVTSKQAKIHNTEIPKGFTEDSADFVNKLLMRRPTSRLGYGGIQEIKNHPWVKFFNWKDLYLMKIKAPFMPSDNLEKNIDQKYCNMKENIGIKTEERYQKIINSKDYKIVFNNYSYFFREEFENVDTFENPHLIYVELEKKEQEAFRQQFREIKERIESVEELPKRSLDDFTSSNSSKETGSTIPRHRKNIQSVGQPQSLQFNIHNNNK